MENGSFESIKSGLESLGSRVVAQLVKYVVQHANMVGAISDEELISIKNSLIYDFSLMLFLPGNNDAYYFEIFQNLLNYVESHNIPLNVELLKEEWNTLFAIHLELRNHLQRNKEDADMQESEVSVENKKRNGYSDPEFAPESKRRKIHMHEGTESISWPPDFESIASKVPEDIWITIFNFVPDLRDFLMAGRVNSEWLALIKAIVATHHLILLARSDVFMKSFSDVSNLVKGSLDLSYNDQITNETLSMFSHIRELTLEENSNIDDTGVMGLTELRKLRTGRKIRDRALINMVNLRDLHIDNYRSRIRGDCFMHTKNLISLRLEKEVRLKKEAFVHLINLKTLKGEGTKSIPEILEKYKTDANEMSYDEVVSKFATPLTTLETYSSNWNDDLIVRFANLTSLSLHRRTGITDIGLSVLTNLVHLDISADGYLDNPNAITGNSLKLLVNLKSLNLEGLNTPEGSGDYFEKMSNLTKLNVRSLRQFTDDSFWDVAINLVELSIENTRGITGKCLSRMPNLKVLKTSGSEIKRKYFKHLTEKLVKLSVGNYPSLGCDPEDEIKLKDLERLIGLTSLTLHSDRPDRGGDEEEQTEEIVARWKSLSNLKKLKLFGSPRLYFGCGLSSTKRLNAVLASFSNLTSLKLFHASNITDETVKSLKNLTKFKINFCDGITADSISKLKKLRNLTWIRWRDDVKISYSPLSKLVNLVRLKLLILGKGDSKANKVEKLSLSKTLLNLDGKSLHRLTDF